MTPLFANFVGQDSMLNSKMKMDVYYTVQVKFDNNEIKQYRLFTDQTIQEISFDSYESIENSMGERSNLNYWQLALFNVWKKESLKHNYDTRKIVYNFLGDEKNGNWLAAKPENPSSYFPTKLSFNSSWFYDTWNEVVTSTHNFFKPAVEPEVYNFINNPFSPTSFRPEQIAKIVNRINELQRERQSFWSLNKELKTKKIEGLKNLLEQSKNSTAYKSVMLALENTNLTAGIISSRTFDLLMELKKECDSDKINIYSTSI